MMADAFYRVSGKLSCAIATSGPGMTNLITGIATAFYDSVPVLFLTGNVATFRSKGDTGVRQIGFQETDAVAVCGTITNYAVLVNDPKMVLYEIEKALFLATHMRPGPVLVDIPDDIQRMDYDPKDFVRFHPTSPISIEVSNNQTVKQCALQTVQLLKNSQRPVLILGWGVRLSKCEALIIRLINQLGIPVALTWAVRDLLPSDHSLVVGGFGTHGTRPANFAVQNADFILSIGSRLDTKATGSPPATFAREAKIVMVDIDNNEINKFKKFDKLIDVSVPADAGHFCNELLSLLDQEKPIQKSPWLNKINEWKERYPALLPEYLEDQDINPYYLIDRLSIILKENDLIFSDTGCALAWMMQAFQFKANQRFFHAFNFTPMGYGLPGAIGGSFAAPDRRMICFVGDGSIQMNIQELATLMRHNLPIKILLINNHGHGMVQQTQEMWLGGKYYATTIEGGLGFPDFVKVSEGYGIPARKLSRKSDIDSLLRWAVDSDGPTFLDIEISADKRVIPQVQFGRPNEDATPLLPREEFMGNMIVPPLPVSLKNLA